MELVTSRERVADAIALEQVSENTFLSKSLWTPYGHPSAYGGQLMAQAVHAASLFADPGFVLHVRIPSCFSDLEGNDDHSPTRLKRFTVSVSLP